MKDLILKWLTGGTITIDRPQKRYWNVDFDGTEQEISKFEFYSYKIIMWMMMAGLGIAALGMVAVFVGLLIEIFTTGLLN